MPDRAPQNDLFQPRLLARRSKSASSTAPESPVHTKHSYALESDPRVGRLSRTSLMDPPLTTVSASKWTPIGINNQFSPASPERTLSKLDAKSGNLPHEELETPPTMNTYIGTNNDSPNYAEFPYKDTIKPEEPAILVESDKDHNMDTGAVSLPFVAPPIINQLARRRIELVEEITTALELRRQLDNSANELSTHLKSGIVPFASSDYTRKQITHIQAAMHALESTIGPLIFALLAIDDDKMATNEIEAVKAELRIFLGAESLSAAPTAASVYIENHNKETLQHIDDKVAVLRKRLAESITKKESSSKLLEQLYDGQLRELFDAPGKVIERVQIDQLRQHANETRAIEAFQRDLAISKTSFNDAAIQRHQLDEGFERLMTERQQLHNRLFQAEQGAHTISNQNADGLSAQTATLLVHLSKGARDGLSEDVSDRLTAALESQVRLGNSSQKDIVKKVFEFLEGTHLLVESCSRYADYLPSGSKAHYPRS